MKPRHWASHHWSKSWWLGDTLSACAGLLITFSLAPYNIWGLSLAAPAILYCLLQNLSGKAALRRSFAFGAGMFGNGTSWVYISIHDFGYTSAPLAVVMTAIFVLGLALVFAFPFYLYARFFNTTKISGTLGFSAIWVLGEWSRSWFLTGFPWLYLGYAHIDTWLSGWAPIFGVFGLSFASVLSGAILSHIVGNVYSQKNVSTKVLYTLSVIVVLWSSGKWLSTSSNEPPQSKAISVAIVQPNTPLEVKWNPIFRDQIMETLRLETEKHWDKDLIIWPEAAVPIMYHDAEYFLSEIEEKAHKTSTGLILGILYDDEKPMTFYNSIVGLGRADGIYFKQRLVPFGEYVPLEKWLRGLIAFFNLPNSIIFPGPSDQEILKLDEAKIAPSICYEIVYPDLVARLSAEAELLITISNDAWFGSSIGPLQHLQMAQMRALENRRYVLRGTNTGVSAIIAPNGKIQKLSKQFEQHTIEQFDVKLIKSRTFFSYWGSWPIVLTCFLSLALLLLARLKERQKHIAHIPG